MSQVASRKLDLEIRRHRDVLKTWVIKRIADTPVFSDEEMEATSWFHELPVDERSRLVTDLARLNIPGSDAFAIATGPLGVLFTRFPGIFEGRETEVDSSEDFDESMEHLAVTVGALNEFESSDPNWFEGWKNFERDLEGPVWPAE